MNPRVMNLPSGRGLLVETKELALPAGDTIANFQFGIDVPVTELIVGQPRLASPLGAELFRPVGARTVSFKYPKFGLERFGVKDAKRPMRSKFQASELRADDGTGKLERYGWTALLDRDELDNADAADSALSLNLRIREKHQRLARDLVDLSVEADRATVALAAGSYSQSSPDLDVTISGGSEWNHSTGGDSFASLWAVAELLAATNGVSVADLDVYLTHVSLRAAFQDPVFRAARNVGGATEVPSVDELRRYWGVRRVIVGDGYKQDSAGTGIESLYGDVAIIRVSTALTGYDLDAGNLDSFCRFYWQQFGPEGRAMQNIWIAERTSWAFPWEHWEEPLTVNTKAAAIIRNTHT
jgi:hypothetical protein